MDVMEIKIKTIVLTLALILPMVGYAQEWLEKARKDAKYVPGTINGRTEEEIKTILLKADQGDAAAQFEMFQITKAKGEKSMSSAKSMLPPARTPRRGANLMEVGW